MIDKISAVTVKKIRKTPNILFSAQQSATQNKNKKIKSITSATSVTTASALEKKIWCLTNQLSTTASDKPERGRNNNHEIK